LKEAVRLGARYFAGEEPLTPDRVRWASKARPRVAGELVKSQNSKPFFFDQSHPSATAISYRVSPSNKAPLGILDVIHCHPLSSMSGLKNYKNSDPEAVVAFFGWTVAIIAGVLPEFPTKAPKC